MGREGARAHRVIVSGHREGDVSLRRENERAAVEVFTGRSRRPCGDRRGVTGESRGPASVLGRGSCRRDWRKRIRNGLTGRLLVCNVSLMPKSTRVDDVGPSGTEPVGSEAVSRRKHA
ncbi:hypothetical protein HMPREF9056_01885 [Actinomyces sp. oral taxon 170 str. F0386]|nr:hypothetical protein HMPREF9056_01885 [Actinomyces sp. oral taxon 170 str. F0386]